MACDFNLVQTLLYLNDIAGAAFTFKHPLSK